MSDILRRLRDGSVNGPEAYPYVMDEIHSLQSENAELRRSMTIIGGSAFEAMALEMEARAVKAEARVVALQALCRDGGDEEILADPRRWFALRERLRAAGRGEGKP